jgi:hypothetical protein
MINIFKQTFECNNITPNIVAQLLKNWFLFGVLGVSRLQCKTCLKQPGLPPKEPRLSVLSILEFPEVQHPPYLWFNVEGGNIHGKEAQKDFLASIAWLFILKVGTQKYILHSRGYWDGDHYW